MRVQFWFEFASTYSYPAAMRIEHDAARCGVAIEWKPFLLGPIFAAQGWDDSPFNLYPAKGRYMWRDLERICEAQGLPFHRPSQFPRSGLLAARVASAAEDERWLPEFVRAVYQANFAHDRDITDRAVISELLQDWGCRRRCGSNAQRAPTSKPGCVRGPKRRSARHFWRAQFSREQRALLGQRPTGIRARLGGTWYGSATLLRA